VEKSLSIIFRAIFYLQKGPDYYREKDVLDQPPSDLDEEELAILKSPPRLAQASACACYP